MPNVTLPNNPDLIVQTSLASLSIQAMLYGGFTTLFCASTYLMARRQREISRRSLHARRPLWKNMPFFSGIILFLTLSAEWMTYIWRSFEAFQGSSGPHAFYGTVTLKSYVVQSVLGYLALLVLDTIIVYRLWVIWNFSYKVVILPCFTWISSFALILALTWSLITNQTTYWYDILIPTFVAHAVTNIYCSALIAWKLWRTSPGMLGTSFGRRTVSWYLVMLIEMAALYLGIELVFFVVYLAGSNTKSVFENSIPPVAAIALMFINVRVGMGYNPQAPSEYVGQSSSDRHASHGARLAHRPPDNAVLHITADALRPPSDISLIETLPVG